MPTAVCPRESGGVQGATMGTHMFVKQDKGYVGTTNCFASLPSEEHILLRVTANSWQSYSFEFIFKNICQFGPKIIKYKKHVYSFSLFPEELKEFFIW